MQSNIPPPPPLPPKLLSSITEQLKKNQQKLETQLKPTPKQDIPLSSIAEQPISKSPTVSFSNAINTTNTNVSNPDVIPSSSCSIGGGEILIRKPSICPQNPFVAIEDASKLYKALKGFGTNETKLIDVLCKRSLSQRQEIAKTFQIAYGKELPKKIMSETSGNFRKLLVTLLKSHSIYEAENLRASIEGLGTDEKLLIDIVCTKSNSEMIELRNTYKTLFNSDMEDDVKDDLSGQFKRFIVALIDANRLECQHPDWNRASLQAKELLKAGEKRIGTDETVFIRIFATESYTQLRMIFDEYEKIANQSIEKAIDSELSWNLKKAFLCLTKFVRNPYDFYAQRLYDSLKGLGTRDSQLIRICVLHAESDMKEIKSEFQAKFEKSLESWINSECSGDYRRALLCLIGDPVWK